MSQGVHLVSNSNPGCILPDGQCPASGRATLLSSSGYGGHKLFAGANVLLKTFPMCRSKSFSITCKAGNNNRRNPDFSRHHKGSSRGRNRHYQERDHWENFEETDPLPSKNGSLLSSSSNQRFSATATPGRREKEIVELFRKVQAQLRERAAIKEEKKIEATQQGQGERGTVDSLLKLLRKHSLAQGKKSSHEEELNVEQEEEPNSSFFSSSSIPASDEVVEPDPVPFRRPASNFRRRSPVPQVKFQPVFSADEGKKGTTITEPEPEPEPELLALEVSGEEISDEISDASDDITEEMEEPSAEEVTDLATLKLSELRDIAKSRGIRGYSKLKKAELVGLLSGDDSYS